MCYSVGVRRALSQQVFYVLVSELCLGGNSVATLQFADTSEIMQYTDDIVPDVIANKPYYRLPATFDYVSAVL